MPQRQNGCAHTMQCNVIILEHTVYTPPYYSRNSTRNVLFHQDLFIYFFSITLRGGEYSRESEIKLLDLMRGLEELLLAFDVYVCHNFFFLLLLSFSSLQSQGVTESSIQHLHTALQTYFLVLQTPLLLSLEQLYQLCMYQSTL